MTWTNSLLLFVMFFLTQVAPVITSPQPGEILQGLVVIYGKTDTAGFVSSDLEYTYTNNEPNTWFIISQANIPVHNGILATWDTTEIVDGEYTLRLSVHLSDGTITETLVSELHIQNYTPTIAPTPLDFQVEILPTKMTVSPLFPVITKSVLPPNSAELNQLHIYTNLAYGALVSFVFLLLIFIYTRLRRN